MTKHMPAFRGVAQVRADATNANKLIEQIQAAVESLRSENDTRLNALETGMRDVVRDEKVDRINSEVSKLQTALDDIVKKTAAANIGATPGRKIKDPEYTSAFAMHVRRGDVQANLNKGVADEGGYLAPVEWDRTITDKLTILSPMRSIARVQTIGGAGFTKLFNMGGTASGWVGETAARPETNTGTFQPMTYTTGEMYANPAATKGMLDDSEIDLETWLADEVDEQFSLQEGVAFVSGNGTNKPTGILTYITGGANAAAHPYGAITEVNSGATAEVRADGIIKLIYDLPSKFTQGARFIMNRATEGQVRLLKDGQGNYLWQPSYQAGVPAMLSGYPLTEMAAMPNVEADANPIMFGNFERGYIVINRTGVRVLRDPYTNKPYIHFYSTKRVGGGLLNPEPLRALKIAD